MKNDSTVKVWVAIIWGIALGLGIWIGLSLYFQPDLDVPTVAATEIISLANTPSLPTSSLPPAPTSTLPTPPDTQTPSASGTSLPSATPQPTATPTITPTPIPSRTRPSSLTPGPARPTVIGYSVAGRPLEVFRFGRGSTERLIVAGIHGGYEWNTIALADELISHLNQNPGLIPEGMRLYILRSFNPDGEARSQGFDGRANQNGVDLNRNFPSLWQESWSRDGCWDYGPISAGAHPGSEPETQALMKFFLNNNIDALINYHSAALGIFPGGQPPDTASIRLAEMVASMSNYPYPPIDTGCTFSGQLIDWASDQGIASVDIELTDHVRTDFEQNLLILTQFLTWTP
jgi:predicted deacylase